MQKYVREPRLLFLDQAGQLGGAEWCLADVAVRYCDGGRVTLFEDGPFRNMLEAHGVSVSVLCPERLSARVTKSSGFTNILAAAPHFLRLALRVTAKARDFDVIYANTAKALIVGSFAAHLTRRPLIYHLHDIISADHFSAMNRRLLVTFGNRARAVIANSHATRQSFVASGGREELTHVVYNGFDSAAVQMTAEDDPARLRKELGIENGARCALMVGRLTPWKGQHVLLDALPMLPDVHAIFAGDAVFTDEDRSYADRLRERASDPQLAGRVHFLGFRDDLNRWYSMADLVVHASTAPEPFGRVIVEGMLRGKPVIATSAGGACEILRNQETGYLIRPGDAQEMACAIRGILENPEAAASVAQRGRERARREYSKEAMLGALDRIIAGVLGKNGVKVNGKNHHPIVAVEGK